MTVSIARLRGFGAQRVVVTMPEGTVTGRLIPGALGDRAIVALLIPDDGDPTEPIVIDLERISSVVPAADTGG